MALCKSSLPALRAIWRAITPQLRSAISRITEVTGKLKTLQGSVEVELLTVTLMPFAPEVLGWMSAALDILSGMLTRSMVLSDKVSFYLDSLSEEERNAKLAKLASVAARISDFGHRKEESFYDAVVQLQIIQEKAT